MSARFDKFFPFIIKWEGSVFENDPDDPGGATKFGIDQRSHPSVDIRNLTLEGAKAIYLASYWNRIHADELPPKIGEIMMDIAVNNGSGRAVKWLQSAVGARVDGVLGPMTIESAGAQSSPAFGGPDQIATRLLNRRGDFYREIGVGRMAKFLRGWLNRNEDLRKWVGL